VYHPESQGMYEAVTAGNLPVLQLLLDHLGEAQNVNLPLRYQLRNQDNRNILIRQNISNPQINLNLLNAAIHHKHLHIVKYLISEWKHRDVIIKNRCILHETLPHVLPALLFTLSDREQNNKSVEMLTACCDPMDLGLNWVCNTPLSEQKNVDIGHLPSGSGQHLLNEKVLYINSSLCIGSNVAALIWKCQSLWTANKRQNSWAIKQLITMMVLNGLDWYIAGDCDGVKNAVLRHSNFRWKLTDYNVDICKNQSFVRFFRKTVQEALGKWRSAVQREFEQLYPADQGMIDIFRWYVLDFVVPREDVLDGFAYFTMNK